MAETQNDPLLPGYSFNAHLVTGLTPIEAQGYLDFFIDRPLGMKGYILNLTIRGEGVINNHGEQFVCRPGDMLLFPPGEIHHYGRHPDASEWYHQWVYFRPRAYWHEWLNWPTIFAQTGFFRPDEQWQARFGELFGQIVDAHPENALASRQQNGFGGIVSAEITGGRAGAAAFLDSLELFSLAESLGGVESLACHPGTMTHASMPADVQAAAGIAPGLVRLSGQLA